CHDCCRRGPSPLLVPHPTVSWMVLNLPKNPKRQSPPPPLPRTIKLIAHSAGPPHSSQLSSRRHHPYHGSDSATVRNVSYYYCFVHSSALSFVRRKLVCTQPIPSLSRRTAAD